MSPRWIFEIFLESQIFILSSNYIKSQNYANNNQKGFSN
jgi:hypothetical protein